MLRLCTGPESYSVAVCNRGPGALEFHPSRLVPKEGPGGPKLKILATLRFEQVPRARACDPGFWALAFAQWVPGATEYHRAEVLYDVLLPWLAGGRISECLATEARFSRVWRTPCRSNTACMKNLLEALRLLTRSAPWRPLLAALRREALVLAAEELALQPLASPQATAALGVLEPYSSKLRLEQLPAKPAPTCKVIALFFSVPGNVSDEVHRRLSKLVTDVWDAHGGGALLVCECPLGEGPAREWAVCGDAGLARAYGLEAAQEPKVLLFRADGRMLTEEGLQTLVRDPTGKDFPWDPAGLAASDLALLRFGCRSAALRRKDAAELGRLAKAVHVLAVEAPLPEERRDLSWRLPGACDASSAALARGELLKAAEVEHFAGEAEPPHSTGFVDFTLPQVDNARQAVAMLCHAAEVAKSSAGVPRHFLVSPKGYLVRRSREASVSQRLVLEWSAVFGWRWGGEMETIAFISSVVLDVLPPPDPDGGLWSTEISVEGANSEQRQGLRALLDLALLYAHCWQGLEAAERGAESERCLAAAKLLCAFDALLRRRGGSVLAELLFEESCSVHLGLCGDQRSLETVLQRLELLEPRWLLQRRGVLRYLAARERGCQRRIFELRQLGTAFEVRKYSATMNLLRKVLERLGLELMPRNGMMSEMEALGGWLFGRGAQLGDTCPELYWLRDMAALFKFLGTMEPRTAELLRKRRDTNEYQFWRLTFDAESSVRPGYGFGFEVPAIFWEVQGVRGHDQDIADVTATAFGRELTLGEGLVVQSPADVGKLLQRPSCTEEDVLHAPELPTFEETLSPDEAESLMSFLTVPYLQLPLVLDFFASQDRASYLFNPQLQRLLRAVLFEPRAFQESGVGANLVPAQKGEGEAEKLFGTSWGLLLSDLCHAPSSILDPLRRILGAVSELANAEANSSEAPFLLFGLELASDLLRFVEFANELQGSSVLREGSAWLRSFLQQLHGTVQRWPGSAAAGYCALHGFDSGQFAEAMASWCAVRTWHHFGCHETEEAGLTANQRLKRFLQAQGIDTGRTSEEMLNQFTRQDGRYRPVFLRVGQQTLRVPNFGHRRNEAGQTGVPEARLFRALQVHRSKILAAFLAAPEHLTPVAQAGLRAEPAELVALQWAHKGAGVFVADELQLSVQTGELLWREDGLKPLPDSMTRFEDFETIFGDASLQCGVVSRTRHRLWVHLVGKGFDLLEWDAAPQAAFKQGNTGAIFAAVETEADGQEMAVVPAEEGPSAMELDEPASTEAWSLLDLLSAAEGSELAGLTELLVRVEDLSHILAWAQEEGGVKIASIELPRLKLTLQPTEGGLEVKDAGGWFVKSVAKGEAAEPALSQLLAGLQQALLLENAAGDLRVLLPNHDVTRPVVNGEPFGTQLLFNRSSFGWQEAMDSPYYLYPVHATHAYMQATSLAAGLYLALLRLMLRDYAASFAELENCWTDVPLLAEEQWVFNQFGGSLQDRHPDAHAVRCKLALCTAFVEDVVLPFELHVEMDEYLAKRGHVSRGLWLSEEEELQLLRRCKSSTRRVKARLELLGAKARGQQSVVLRASPAQHGGQPWSRLNAQSRQVLGQGSRLRRLQFRHPALPENAPQTAEWPEQVEGEALMKIIWSDELLQDDESGVNRQLGFVFLYMVLLGQLSLKLCGLDVSGSLGPLLARVFHLKLARWGKELVEEGESEPQVSRAMATLAMMVRGQGAGWPPLPSAQRAQLAAGLNLYDAQGRESPLKHWLDTVDRIFQQSLAEAAPPRPPGEEWAPASTVQLPNLREPVLLRRAKDETCSSRQLPPPLATLAKGEILATLQLQRFVSLQEALPVEGTSPFDLAGHVGARSLVAQDLLRRLKEDCARYGEMLSQRRRPVLSADPGALAELEEALRRSAEEDYAEGHLTATGPFPSLLRSATGELQEKANFLHDGQDEIFDFELQRDLCRLEERVSFAYAMSCITSAHAQEELLRLNPFASDTDLVLSLSLKVALLSQRLLQSRRAAQLCRAARRNSAESPEAGLELRQQRAQLAELLCEQRCYLQDARGFDPRYLIFEFMQQIVLRPRQVEMVDWFMKSHREGESRVQQMIMGAGKTTVVGPLLSLMLASPEVLVTQVMPSPLLDQTRQILRACFARLLPKRIVTFQFDRQVEDCPETVMKLYTKLEACRRAGGIVCSSPEAIKSMMLKLIEQLHALSSYDFSQLAPGAANRSNRDMVRQREVLERRSGMADAAVQLLKLWRPWSSWMRWMCYCTRSRAS
ncbi:unnamed protein product [Effrenium voratum]|nr:unnamed protein product [Effrenium voratum]